MKHPLVQEAFHPSKRAVCSMLAEVFASLE